MKKYLNVSIEDFLQSIVNSNTKNFRSDFEIDKQMFLAAAERNWKQDKVFLWMSRENGTHCVREYEAFIKDSAAHTTWKHYADTDSEHIVAYAVELTGYNNGVLFGNIYELDYKAHVADMINKAVEPLEVQKFFEDGFVSHAPLERSSYGYYTGLVEEHGSIIDSLFVPVDEERLTNILAAQGRERNTYSPAKISEHIVSQGSLDDVLSTAKKLSSASADADKSKIVIDKGREQII